MMIDYLMPASNLVKASDGVNTITFGNGTSLPVPGVQLYTVKYAYLFGDSSQRPI
jgi:hypothetical protein